MNENAPSIPPPKWDLASYIPYLLSSGIEVKYPDFMEHRPPIVTIEEIQNAKNICPHAMEGCLLLEINESTILKVGLMAQMGEVEALLIMKKRTSVPVPEVFNAYTIAEIGFIVMSKIPGLPLNQCWEQLTRDSKESIVQQLSGFIQEWRQIEGPLFGSIDGGPCEDILFHHSWDGEPRQYGPFSTRKEFNEGVVKALGYARPNGQPTKRDMPLVEKILESSSRDERKVFTHGDLHRSNIMVNGGTISGIIDWGAAGYSVSAREYFCLRWQAYDFEWRDLISTILETDEYEFWAEVNQSMIDYTGF